MLFYLFILLSKVGRGTLFSMKYVYKSKNSVERLKKKKVLNPEFGINIHLMSRMFANGPRDRGSILGRVIPITKNMVHDTALLNTQHYKVRIKGKVEQFTEWISALPNTTVL